MGNVNKGGRPTKYEDRFAQELDEYFDIESGKDIVGETKRGEPVSIRVASDLPTLAGFACKIGVNRDTLQEWAKKHPAFSVAYKKAKEHQERILIENGLKGGYNPAFAIFTAKNLLSWRDKHEHTGKDGGPIESKTAVVIEIPTNGRSAKN